MDVSVKYHSVQNGLTLVLKPHELGELNPFPWFRFRVGTVTGIIEERPLSIDIRLIKNSKKGNGHFEDAISVIGKMCKHERKSLRVVEILNLRLMQYFLNRGFVTNLPGNNVSKYYF